MFRAAGRLYEGQQREFAEQVLADPEEYRAHPNAVRELGRGETVLIERVPDSHVDLVAVEAP